MHEFESWADDAWKSVSGHYEFIAVRDAAILNLLYPVTEAKFLKFRVVADGRTSGWMVLLDTQMKGHRHFGDLRVGTIVDGLAAPEHVPGAIRAAAKVLEERGVDLVISNQAHEAWMGGLQASGFLTAPSNYVLAISKPLAALLEPVTERSRRFHINRGDGDGPIHL